MTNLFSGKVNFGCQKFSFVFFQIFYYSVNLFKRAGLDELTASHATAGLGATLIIMTGISIPLMDKAGRKLLHLIGLGGMFIFSIMITLTLCLTVSRFTKSLSMAYRLESKIYVWTH